MLILIGLQVDEKKIQIKSQRENPLLITHFDQSKSIKTNINYSSWNQEPLTDVKRRISALPRWKANTHTHQCDAFGRRKKEGTENVHWNKEVSSFQEKFFWNTFFHLSNVVTLLQNSRRMNFFKQERRKK